MRGLAVLVVVVVAGCKGKDAPAPAPAPAPASKPAPELDDAAIDCLLGQAGDNPRTALEALARTRSAAVVRRAAMRMIERARRDGESPMKVALEDAIDVLGDLDDLDGLRAAFAMVDALPGAREEMQFAHEGAMRARVGIAPTPQEIAEDRIGVVIETALAGDVTAAKRIYAAIPPDEMTNESIPELFVAAKVVLGEDPRTELAAPHDPERTLQYIVGGWIVAELRSGGPLKPAVDAAVAEAKTASAQAIVYTPLSDVFARAARLHRGAELAPLFRAVGPRLQGKGADDLRRDLAIAVGEQPAPPAPPPPVCPAVPPRPAATPPVAGLVLTVTEKRGKAQYECAVHDVVIQLREGAKVVGEQTLDGGCQGVCTAQERRDAAKELKAIETAIKAGDASESQTDYNFTQCIFEGPNAGRIEKVGGRDVALIANHYIGPHDIEQDKWRLALEVCGKLYVSDAFGHAYGSAWELKELALRQDGDTIVVDGKSAHWNGVAFRLALPACPGEPVPEVLETE